MPRFFHLTSAFFGLTSDYKAPLLEEVFICTQHLKGFSYSDVLALPVYERRFFIGMLMRKKIEEEEYMETMREQKQISSGKGTKKTRISGEALKNKFKSGDMPTT